MKISSTLTLLFEILVAFRMKRLGRLILWMKINIINFLLFLSTFSFSITSFTDISITHFFSIKWKRLLPTQVKMSSRGKNVLLELLKLIFGAWDDLDDEPILHREYLYQCQLVCKKWNGHARDVFNRHIRLYDMDARRIVEKFVHGNPFTTNDSVKSMEFLFKDGINRTLTFQALAVLFPNLETISTDCAPNSAFYRALIDVNNMDTRFENSDTSGSHYSCWCSSNWNRWTCWICWCSTQLWLSWMCSCLSQYIGGAFTY